MKINQTHTAIDNYHFHVLPEVAQPCQQRILGMMKREDDIPDWTIGEIAQATGMDKSSVSARRFEMIANGLVILGRDRKCKISNRVCQVVRLPS